MKKLMAANWKMYKTRAEAAATAAALRQAVGTLPADREVLVFPPFTAIDAAHGGMAGAAGFSVGGQDLYPAVEGAFTGEIAPAMLKDAGATWVLTGHSERRHVLGESDAFVGQKTAFALAQGLKVVLCIGEKLEEREAGQLEAVLARQLEGGLAGSPGDVSPEDLAIAYEPVWAIGTGKVAGPAEILDAHATVRAQLKGLLANGAQIRILYGGSVKPDNAGEIISLDNVDGVLVGGASLQAESFSKIVLA
ncbi:triose-phosphate isomerase [Megalodesulfovibrio paquesii]